MPEAHSGCVSARTCNSGDGTSQQYRARSISGHNIVFQAANAQGRHGVYVWRDGTITRVVSVGDVLNGLTVGGFLFSNEAIQGDTMAFSVYTWGINQVGALYTATFVPAPGAAALGACTCLLAAHRRRSPAGGAVADR